MKFLDLHQTVAAAIGVIAGLVATPAQADDWTQLASQGGVYSVETPCNAQESSSQGGDRTENFSGLVLEIHETVECLKGHQVFQVSIARIEVVPPPSRSLFDAMMIQLANNQPSDRHPTMTTINGRRAWLNRQSELRGMAQAGIIEVAPDSVAFLLGGEMADSGTDEAAHIALIDRFFDSFEIRAE